MGLWLFKNCTSQKLKFLENASLSKTAIGTFCPNPSRRVTYNGYLLLLWTWIYELILLMELKEKLSTFGGSKIFVQIYLQVWWCPECGSHWVPDQLGALPKNPLPSGYICPSDFCREGRFSSFYNLGWFSYVQNSLGVKCHLDLSMKTKSGENVHSVLCNQTLKAMLLCKALVTVRMFFFLRWLRSQIKGKVSQLLNLTASISETTNSTSPLQEKLGSDLFYNCFQSIASQVDWIGWVQKWYKVKIYKHGKVCSFCFCDQLMSRNNGYFSCHQIYINSMFLFTRLSGLPWTAVSGRNHQCLFWAC